MLLGILREEFTTRQKRNARYSLRAFARALQIHSSTLSAIMSGKRKITPQQAQRILRVLEIPPKERKVILLNLMSEGKDAQIFYHTLSDDIFSVVASWEHFALLSCLDLTSTGQTEKALAAKLKISETEAREALLRLKRFNLVLQVDNLWHATGKSFTTNDQVPSEACRQNNREYITKALASLENHSVEDRDISGITMAISSKKLPAAKKIIQNFRREMAEFLETDPKDEVYRLNIQLFPLSK